MKNLTSLFLIISFNYAYIFGAFICEETLTLPEHYALNNAQMHALASLVVLTHDAQGFEQSSLIRAYRELALREISADEIRLLKQCMDYIHNCKALYDKNYFGCIPGSSLSWEALRKKSICFLVDAVDKNRNHYIGESYKHFKRSHLTFPPYSDDNYIKVLFNANKHLTSEDDKQFFKAVVLGIEQIRVSLPTGRDARNNLIKQK